MAINPGKYNVFNEDGSLHQWGDQSTHVSVTTGHRAKFFIGDNAEPFIERLIPRNVRTLNDFDKYTLSVFQAGQVLYATKLMTKLHTYQEAYQEIIDQKNRNNGLMILNLMPVWRWIEKIKELNEYQEICEELMTKLMDELHKLAPSMLTEQFTIIFTMKGSHERRDDSHPGNKNRT